MTAMKKLFGTDGIRGVAGEPPLDPPTVYAVGLALADDLLAHAHGETPAVVLGQDTRESGRWIAETIAGGLMARGLAVRYAGVIPTPAVAHLTRARGMAAGVMISASHNPFQDNGIKIFGHNGYKLPDAEEAELERAIEHHRRAHREPRRAPLLLSPELCEDYVAFLAGRVEGADFSQLEVLVDCAQGAASAVAASVFRRVGLRARLLANQPDGRNINAGCGALHPEALAHEVPAAGASAGLALDGDADRSILVDASGGIVDGDAVLFMSAGDHQRRQALTPPLVVGTVMTNLGLELALSTQGIALERTPVGDKYVLEKMLATGARLGGEPSGHVIFGAEATTGDGLLTALHCFALMAGGAALADLAHGWTRLPQRIVNVRVRHKPPLEQLASVQGAIRLAEAHFGREGRILVRYSGTEPLARVMVEAASPTDVERHANAIGAALHAAIGA